MEKAHIWGQDALQFLRTEYDEMSQALLPNGTENAR